MKTQARPLDQDDLAMADLAEVRDWTAIAGPDNDDSGPQDGALAYAARPVQHGEARSHQVGRNQLAFAVPTEEEQRVNACFLERPETLIRALRGA